jgi:NTE family protein/lysophospholipid hydrolase
MDKFELKKGDELFSPIKAELYEHGMFVVASGAVGMFRTRNVSVLRDFAFSVYKAGEVFGVYSLLMRDDVAKSKDYSYIFRCVALEDCCVHFLRRDSFQAFVEESPEKLEIFIRSVIAQEWRVSSSILNNYLGIHATPYHSLQNNGVPTVEEVSTEENSKSISRENSVSNLSVYEDAETKSEINIPKSLFAEELKIKRGHVLYEKGDLADSFYLVKEGQFELIGEHTKVSTLADQEILLGGIPFFTTTARLETAIAQQDSRVLKFTQESFSHLIETDTKYAFKLLKAVGEQLSTECQTFFELGLQKVWHKSGETIYEEGDEADSLHVVVSGRIRLSRNSESARKLSDLCGVQDKLDNSVFISPEKNLRAVDASQGDSFGEPSLITVCTSDSTETEILSKRLFNACAIRDSLIVRISKACLKRILRKHPSSMVKLSRSVSERFQDMVSRMNERAVFSTGGKVKIISLFPSGKATTALHVRSVSTRLQAILSESHGTVLKLNSAAVDSMVGYSITKQLHLNSEIAKLSSWLSEQEDLFNFILLESDCLVGMSEFDDDDQMMTDWDSFCIRQSDCIIHVGFSNQKENSELTKLEREFHAMYPNLECLRYLLLLHPALTRKPKNTKSWLEKRRVHCVQHVRVDFLPDWERIGRLLSGKSIGIVFGGGGARGMAHIGVIKALEERGIPIDMAGGTSQGAFIAGLYASRLSARGVELGAREYAFGFHLLSYLRSFTLPLLSYFEGTRFTNLVKNAFGEDDILDFWIPYFCISTSVSYSNVRVHQSVCFIFYCYLI